MQKSLTINGVIFDINYTIQDGEELVEGAEELTRRYILAAWGILQHTKNEIAINATTVFDYGMLLMKRRIKTENSDGYLILENSTIKYQTLVKEEPNTGLFDSWQISIRDLHSDILKELMTRKVFKTEKELLKTVSTLKLGFNSRDTSDLFDYELEFKEE